MNELQKQKVNWIIVSTANDAIKNCQNDPEVRKLIKERYEEIKGIIEFEQFKVLVVDKINYVYKNVY